MLWQRNMGKRVGYDDICLLFVHMDCLISITGPAIEMWEWNDKDLHYDHVVIIIIKSASIELNILQSKGNAIMHALADIETDSISVVPIAYVIRD